MNKFYFSLEEGLAQERKLFNCPEEHTEREAVVCIFTVRRIPTEDKPLTIEDVRRTDTKGMTCYSCWRERNKKEDLLRLFRKDLSWAKRQEILDEFQQAYLIHLKKELYGR